MKIKQLQNNSLVKQGDFITFKTDLPIYPSKTRILGYYLTTNDIVDREEYICVEAAIVLQKEVGTLSENSLPWVILNKNTFGVEIPFNTLNLLTEQQEDPYYIYFKISKIKGSKEIINVNKFSLRIEDKRADSWGEYPAWDNSIFKELNLYNSDIVKWSENVLRKLEGNAIMPTFVSRGKDYSLFWGWITHFYGAIVIYARLFLDILKNKTSIKEFFRQKDLILDERTSVQEDLSLYSNEEILYIPKINYALDGKGSIVERKGHICSSILEVREGNVLYLKLSNLISEDFSKNHNLLVSFSFYNQVGQVVTFKNININTYSKIVKVTIPKGKEIRYFAISYPLTYIDNQIFIVDIFVTGDGYATIKFKDRKEVFNIYSHFKNRGTKRGLKYIKKIYQSVNTDSFYSDYLDSSNVGWFLNKNFPLKSLSEPIDIEEFIIEEQNTAKNETKIKFSEKILPISDLDGINLEWGGKTKINSATLFFDFFEKESREVIPQEEVIFAKGVGQKEIVLKNYLNRNKITFPFRLLDNKEQTSIFKNLENVDFSDEMYFFLKYIKENIEVGFLRLKEIILEGENISVSDVKCNFSIIQLPTKLGFLNNSKYFAIHYKNRGIYSDKVANEYITQKVLPYDSLNLFFNLDKQKNLPNAPLKLIKNELVELQDENYRELQLSWKGGVGPYKISILNLESNKIESVISEKTNTDVELYLGRYNIEISDSLEKTLNINEIRVSKVEEISIKVKRYIHPGKPELILSNQNKAKMLDILKVKVFGGTAPYKIIYLNKEQEPIYVYAESSLVDVELKNMLFMRERENYIEIHDFKGRKKNFKVKNEGFLVYRNDSGAGSCKI